MASLTITPSAIVAAASALTESATAGAGLTAGQVIYKDTAGLAQLADANGAAALQAVKGITLHAALTGQPIKYIREGDLTVGAILTAGEFYILGATAPGDIAPIGDKTTGWRVIALGYAISTTVLRVRIIDTGVTI